ncbi:hypothetical protein BDV93DRAFT_558723 [Ceratobasidium sp. AG-I]|nr:hypothetical protein BDV93DRAFT_558723 [Ceratobasidium sp. AG-I]
MHAKLQLIWSKDGGNLSKMEFPRTYFSLYNPNPNVLCTCSTVLVLPPCVSATNELVPLRCVSAAPYWRCCSVADLQHTGDVARKNCGISAPARRNSAHLSGSGSGTRFRTRECENFRGISAFSLILRCCRPVSLLQRNVLVPLRCVSAAPYWSTWQCGRSVPLQHRTGYVVLEHPSVELLLTLTGSAWQCCCSVPLQHRTGVAVLMLCVSAAPY